ncbi:hypothetical protein PTKIN_Ptkin09bG0095000 [Pterospermum kingtungense]
MKAAVTGVGGMPEPELSRCPCSTSISEQHLHLWIKFNSKVTCIDYVTLSTQDVLSSDFWGGSGEPFAPSGKWNVTVQHVGDQHAPTQVYQVDFVILCIGRYSELPNVPDFPFNKGPEVFNGKVLHSMDYAAMPDDVAAELIKGKRVTVVGFQKPPSIWLRWQRRGASHPCTLLFKTVHWTVPEHLLPLVFRGLNRFTELMVHKPVEGFFLLLLALLLSPLFCQPISMTESKDGSLFLKKSQSFSFCENGLMIEGESTPILSDIVIFATGYKSEEKLKNVFKSIFFQNCIDGSSAPFYRKCIHPRIPQIAVLGYTDSPAILYSTEMRSKWLAHFLAGNLRLPTISKDGRGCYGVGKIQEEG